ncbi:6113_t:CDS:2 [Dentiscutata erythropus]|uniref:tyrosinase n=1 Tax=Dentiscutata erythropus TaxID=1348616 RepID=A0A9N8W1T2_9GLOM|nr:6113_t:CDS:2 [Dentiscutata erythropus]
MGLSHSSNYHSSHVRSVVTSEPVIAETFPDLYPRLDILDFYGNETYRPQFDLFIQSYQSFYDHTYEDMRSYYQVSGIHGLPYTPYDGVTGGEHEYNNQSEWEKGRWGGYCHHGDVLFGPWHRPYMLLFESLLVKEAKRIALQYPDNEKEKYVEAAKQLRHPYWDWADEETLKGVPELFLTSEIEINTPQGKKKVKNPLQSYTLPVDLSHPLGEGHNPTDKPHYKVPSRRHVPFTPAGYPTIRYPNSNYEDQNDVLNRNVSVYVSTVFRPGLYQMFHISDYLHFSNHGVRSNNKQTANSLFPGHPSPLKVVGTSHFASIETVHDTLHLIVGGLGGHMAYADIAAFDPMFYFHHVNVDRLFALWQEVFPDSWIQQNIDLNGTFTEEMYTKIDEHTDLTPFRKTETEFWKSSDIRYIEKLGYTYPQVTMFKGQDPKTLQAYLLKLYKPDPYHRRRFFVKLTVESGKLIGPYAIRVFVDLKNATTQTPVTSPHFAGLVAMWRGTKHSHANNNTFVVGTVDITAAMERLGIRSQTYDVSQEVNDTTGLMNSTSIFDIDEDIKIVPVFLDGKGVSPKEAGVNMIEVFSFEHDKVDKNFLVENTGQYYGSKEF